MSGEERANYPRPRTSNLRGHPFGLQAHAPESSHLVISVGVDQPAEACTR